MPNYRYHTAGQMRQNGCMRQNPPAMPQVGGCPLPTENICNPDMDHGDLAELIRVNAKRNIPLRSLAAAIIMTYIEENEENINEL